jgi:hypothetical protein
MGFPIGFAMRKPLSLFLRVAPTAHDRKPPSCLSLRLPIRLLFVPRGPAISVIERHSSFVSGQWSVVSGW